MNAQTVLIRYMRYIGMEVPDYYNGFLQLHDETRAWLMGLDIDPVCDEMIIFCATEKLHLQPATLLRALQCAMYRQHQLSRCGVGVYEHKTRGPYLMLMQRIAPKFAENETLDEAFFELRALMATIVDHVFKQSTAPLPS